MTTATLAGREAQSQPLGTIDVSDPALYEQDTWQPLFARLRREAPVHYCAESRYGPYWSVTRYADIMSVELDHACYSSERGGIQVEDQPADMKRGSFIRMDPPRHTAQRKTVAPVAAPNNLASYEVTIRDRTRAVLDALPRNETFDWVDKVSIELTTMMLATLFDFPWEERRKLAFWSDVAVCNVNAPDALVHSEAERFAELLRMADVFKGLWQERAKAPPKLDLISMMAHSDGTRGMSDMEFVGNLSLLIVGGNDTTRNSMSGGLLALSENPGELAKLRANRALVASLVAETIRYQTPVIHMRRTAVRDTELAGQHIRQGDKVVMWYVSGNRDESVIESPDAFIVDRAKPRQHLSYGAGIHRCVGDRLADLQLRILWEEILARDLHIEVMGPPRRLYSNFIRGIRELPRADRCVIHPMRNLEFGWFIPTRGDTDDYGDPLKIAAGVEMFDRVAIAAEQAGFEYMLIPVGHQCWDAWMTGAMMTRKTSKIRMLIAARPSYINPVLLAKMIATFDQLSQGRISVNLIAGQSEAENVAEGVRWGKEQRYEIMDEEVSILKALWTQTGPTDWHGKYYTLKQAELVPKPYQTPHPKFYLGGGSGQAAELSAKHSDVHLFWGDTTEQIVSNMKELRGLAARHGRENALGFGMRLQIVCRENERDAWNAADGLVRNVTAERTAYIQTYYAGSVANQRVQELARTKGDLIAPHLWSGLTKARPGAGICIVGNPEQCADVLQRYIDIGCHSFCLSGYLHDAEAERFHRLVRPILQSRNPGRMPVV